MLNDNPPKRLGTVFDLEWDLRLSIDKPCVQGSWCLLINGEPCDECCEEGCKEDYDAAAAGGGVGNWNEGGSCYSGGTSMLGEIFAMEWSYPTGQGSKCSSCGKDRAQGDASCCGSQFPCVDAQGNPKSWEWKQNPNASCPCGKAYGCYCDGTVQKKYKCDTSGDAPTCVEDLNGTYSDLPACEAAIQSGDCGVKYACGIGSLGNAMCYKDPQGQFNSKKECEDYPCETRYKCVGSTSGSTSPFQCEPAVDGMYESKEECCQGCCGACDDSPGKCHWFEASFGGFGFNYYNCAYMTRNQCLSHYSLSGSTPAQFTCCTSGDCSCDGSGDCPPCPDGQRQVVKTGTFSGEKECDCEQECPACPFGQWQPFVEDCKCVPCSPCPAGSYLDRFNSCQCKACEDKYGPCNKAGGWTVDSSNECNC